VEKFKRVEAGVVEDVCSGWPLTAICVGVKDQSDQSTWNK